MPKFFEFIGTIEFPSYLNPVIIGSVASLIVTIAVSRSTEVTEAESTYLSRLHQTPADEIDEKKTKMSLLAPAALLFNGIVMPILLMIYYVKPYQRARGELLPDGSIDLLTGEAILVLSWAVVYPVLAWFAARVIRGNYLPTHSTH